MEDFGAEQKLIVSCPYRLLLSLAAVSFSICQSRMATMHMSGQTLPESCSLLTGRGHGLQQSCQAGCAVHVH